MTVLLTVIHVFGLITMGCSGLMSTSLFTSLASNDGAATAFFQGTAITFLLGALMFFPSYRAQLVFCWLRLLFR
jgi:trk system potassium uptake protein TrkH